MAWWGFGLSVLAAAAFGLYLSSTAGRLDRLHRRIDTSRLSLDALLLRRSFVALELAASSILDPASRILIADAAHQARTAADGDPQARALRESELTLALVAVLGDVQDVEQLRGDELGAQLLDELAGACLRVELARRFLNDAVRACRQLRRQRAVRWFQLAGHTPLPSTWEMDDAIPNGLRAD